MPDFLDFMDPLRELTMANGMYVTLFRLGIAALCGGVIGLERGKKRRPAGFRTHMLVCMGAALAMLISQYLTTMANTAWADVYKSLNISPTDAARLGAQVINGIGFLGAGTIIVTGQQQVKGLTTAAGLWASATMGLCIGAGFVEGAIVGCALISVTIIVLTRVERIVMNCSRDLNLNIEFLHIDDLGKIIAAIKEQDIRIFDVEIHKSKSGTNQPSAVFSIRLPKKMNHAKVLTLIADVDNVRSVEEL